MPCPLASKLAGELAPRAQSNTEATTKEPTVPADKLHITLAGREHVVEAGTTAGDALASLANIGAAGGADGGGGGGGGGPGPAGPPPGPGAGPGQRNFREPGPGGAGGEVGRGTGKGGPGRARVLARFTCP